MGPKLVAEIAKKMNSERKKKKRRKKVRPAEQIHPQIHREPRRADVLISPASGKARRISRMPRNNLRASLDGLEDICPTWFVVVNY
jgi:hypothetical protein